MIVTFRSTAFNTSSPEKYFVTRRSYGSDVANWLLNELNRVTRADATIGQKNHGWVVRFSFRETDYQFLIVYRHPEWIGSLERNPSILDRLLHRRRRTVGPEAVLLINSILSASELVQDVRWRPTFNRGAELDE